MTDKADEIIEELKKHNRDTADASYIAGMEAGKREAEYAERPNSSYAQDPTYANFESEIKAKVTELRMKGVRGNLSRNPEVLAIKERHGRA